MTKKRPNFKNTSTWSKGHIPWNKGKCNCYSLETLKEMSDLKKGKPLSKQCHEAARKSQLGIPRTLETRKRIHDSTIGKPKHTERSKKLLSKKGKGRVPPNKGKTNIEVLGIERAKKISEKLSLKARKQCLEGHAIHMISLIQNPSTEELNLRPIVSQVFPYVIYSYPIYRGKRKRNYNVDIAIPKLDIIVEFDGWYHFDTEEHKEQHERRQKEIEEDGWKFIRYDIFHPFPTKEQVQKDILETMNAK